MKKENIIIGLLILFSLLSMGNVAQQECDEFSNLQTGYYSPGSVAHATNFYTITGDDFFSNGTCGTNGANISYLDNVSNTGLFLSGNASIVLDCSYQEFVVKFSNQADQCFSIRVNGQVCGSYFDQGNRIFSFLDSIGNVDIDFDSINNELKFKGFVCELEIGADYAKVEMVCQEKLPLINQECESFDGFGVDSVYSGIALFPDICNSNVNVDVSQGYLGVGPSGTGAHIGAIVSFGFDGSNRNVVMDFDQGSLAGFSINGGSFQNITNSFDSVINGVRAIVRTTVVGGLNYKVLSFSGNMSSIVINKGLTADVTRLLSICIGDVKESETCTNYVSTSSPEGIYLGVGDTTFTFDSTLIQEVSMKIFGNFNNWNLSNNHQADQTYFKVNGNDSVSLETIYNNQPYILNGVTITVDTNDLSFASGGTNWTSGTIIFSGNIDNIAMVQFESGILKICKTLKDCDCDHGDCPCSIDAEFTYKNNGHNYNFISAATGSEYTWGFGDGEISTLDSPFHNYSTPGTYEVCLTNYNLTDSCTITVCDSVTVECITPNANIITPNQDGMDDYIVLNCRSVNVYNRNGLLIASLVNQTTWDGRDANQSLVPMGEYVLLCTDNGVVTNVTVIR